MKIPVQEDVQVQSATPPTPYSNLDTKPDFSGEKVLSDIGSAAMAVDANIKHARDRANAVAVNDQVTKYQAASVSLLDGDEDQPGFLSSKGRDSAALRAQALNSFQEIGTKLEGELTNDKQKELFRRHAAGIYNGTRGRVESHVAQQSQEATTASLAGRVAVSLQSIANNYQDVDGTASEQQAAVEETIRAFRATLGDADAKVAEYREKVVGTRLSQYLSNKDWRGAESYFASTHDDLGPEASRFQKAINEVKRDSVADSLAVGLVKEFSDASGRVNAEAAIAKIDDSQTDVQLKDEAKQRVRQYTVMREQAYKKDTDRISDAALGAYNTGGLGAIPGPLRTQLHERNPELEYKLLHDAERQFSERNSSSAEARRAQSDRNKEALNEFMSLPLQERAALKLDEFLAGRGVDNVGASDVKRHQRGSLDAVQKGESSSANEFLKQARSGTQGLVRGKDNLKALDAEANLAYQRFVDSHKRPPTDKEAAEIVGQLVEKKIKPGLIFDSEQMEFQRRAEARQKGQVTPEATAPNGSQPVPAHLDLDASATPKAQAVPKVPIAQRYQELKRTGKSPKDIADTLNSEGYTKGK